MAVRFEQLIVEEIARLGGVIERIEHNRHPKMYIAVGGRRFVHVCAASPGDHRALRNNRALLRRKFADAT